MTKLVQLSNRVVALLDELKLKSTDANAKKGFSYSTAIESIQNQYRKERDENVELRKKVLELEQIVEKYHAAEDEKQENIKQLGRTIDDLKRELRLSQEHINKWIRDYEEARKRIENYYTKSRIGKILYALK